MIYNLDFILSSLIFLLLILYHFLNRRSLDDSNSRLFRLFIFIGITDIVFDIITTLLTEYKTPEFATLTLVMMTIFYLLQVIVPYALFIYSRTLLIITSEIDKKVSLILSLPAVFTAAMVIFNYKSGIFFTVDHMGNYIHGSLYLGMYIYAGAYALIILITSILTYKRLGSQNFRIICEFIIIMGACVVIQAIWNNTLTTGLGLGLGITVLYLTINNPSDYTDYLTKDYNMKSFMGQLRDLYSRKKSFHILAINIKNLEQINMLLGIHFGDMYLCEISNRLHQILESPYIFRVSSKRFVLITFSIEEYENARDRIKALFNSGIHLNNEFLQLRAVICGIIDAENLNDKDMLLTYMDYLSLLPPVSTDSILIQSDEHTMKSFKYNKEIEKFLLTAIAEDLFEVNYQPVYSIKNMKITAIEALSRLRHPSHGMVPPDVFINIAEHSGLISRIGLLQLHRICRFIKDNPVLISEIDHININLSPAELLREGYSDQLIEIIRKYDLPLSFFQFEITETVATEYNNKLYQLAEDFKKNGISLSLDDFGAGYANLNTVLKLPFSCIKLDRSLLNGILKDAKAEMFYKNIVTALKSLGYEVISEGIEHKEEVELLESFGIEMVQGYYYSKPLSPDELLKQISINTSN